MAGRQGGEWHDADFVWMSLGHVPSIIMGVGDVAMAEDCWPDDVAGQREVVAVTTVCGTKTSP